MVQSGQVGIGVLRSGWLARAASTAVLAVSPAVSWSVVRAPGWPGPGWPVLSLAWPVLA
jgi:hypothetical protein